MPDKKTVSNFTSILHEDRVFRPHAEFSRKAHVKSLAEYKRLYRESVDEPEKFWGRHAKSELVWDRPFKKVMSFKAPDAKWFVGGRLNVSANCLDRHLDTPHANKAALIWEGEPAPDGKPGEERTLTYRQLHREVCRFANVLKRQGLKKGDRVLLYMPMVPEAAIAMLACARIGVVHSVVFGGFSAQSVADRIKDSGAKVVITADGGYRRGAIVPLKKNVDDALKLEGADGKPVAASIKSVIVLRRTFHDIHIEEGRDVWWHRELEYVSDECPPVSLDSEDPLFILYTSGSTGKPKGIYHTTAGYLLYTKLTSKYVFDMKPEDVYWCTADIGWITGHSYLVYGPLANGATAVMYEGAPNWPEPDRFWRMIQRHKVTIFYTAPTAIRTFMKWGTEWVKKHDLSSLRLLGSVGEPINPEAWMWYHDVVGGKRCPIVDTWWQTETGGILISPLPGATPTKPGSATLPFFGIVPEVVDESGKPVPPNTGGKLVIRKPWPSMLRGVWGDKQRYRDVYWKEVKGSYFTGDGCRQDKDGYFWIVGRIDDVLNVAGHRIGTAEVESALVSHPSVAEAAVVGRNDDLKGQALVAFVTLKSGTKVQGDLREVLRNHVAKEIGPVAKPDDIRFAEALPKTRSGKIMRRLLKQIAAGVEIVGDTTTLEDLSVLSRLSQSEE
ncbi:acetyl-coenzyme A synthetase [mine drainage metagenome]|uniref:acetate--CoA ligase n=1 Tax=mine drainage metagenome TaxID=410659 RepID=A0A1J5TD81_9ZZZZ